MHTLSLTEQRARHSIKSAGKKFLAARPTTQENSTEYSVTHPPLSIFIAAQESTSSLVLSQCVTNLSVNQTLPWKQADIKDDPERFFLRLLRLASSCRACTALIDSPAVFTVSLQLASSKTKKLLIYICSINRKIF